MNAFGDLLATYAEKNPDGTAIVHGYKRLSWRGLNDRVNRLANSLADLGIRKGDKGAIMFHNCFEFIESTCALQKIGAVPCPLNYRFVASEIASQANHCDARVFIFDGLWSDEVEKALPDMGKVQHFIIAGKAGGKMPGYEDLVRSGMPLEPEVEVYPEDAASLLYTGGTTGTPKGVVTTYGNYMEHFRGLLAALITILPTVRIPPMRLPVRGSDTIARFLGSDFLNSLIGNPQVQRLIADKGADYVLRLFLWLRGRTRLALKWLCVPPMFHMASFGVILETIWMQTGLFPIVFPENPRFDPREIVDIMQREQPSGIWMVPTMWKKLLELEDIEKADTSSLMLIATGAGVCPAELKACILAYFRNGVLIDAFGQTEMTPIATLKIDSEREKLRDHSVGKPLPGLEIRIVDEDGNDVQQGEIGEIIYSSPWIMRGYYKDRERTDEVIRDGWFHSGDLGFFDASGDVKVVERKKEVISTGGEKIFPQEIEEIIEQNPKVEHACLIGVPDPAYGQIPKAVVQLKEGESASEEEIIAWCRGKMAGFKRPKSVVFSDNLPLNPVGKVQRALVKELFAPQD